MGGTTLGGPGSLGKGSVGSGPGPEPPHTVAAGFQWDEGTFSPPSSSALTASRVGLSTLSPGEGSPADAEAVGEGTVSSRLRFRRPKGAFRLSCVIASGTYVCCGAGVSEYPQVIGGISGLRK